ncbi:hypothetical protein, partial [Salmonella sp. SAL04292]|uniref:hypothetical protein n=1 Tax=Salmonella sp. SAL04292 TaxID=3159870 RepID=UPI00397E669A
GMHAGDAEDGLDAPGFELLDEEFAAGGHGRSFFMFAGMEKARESPSPVGVVPGSGGAGDTRRALREQADQDEAVQADRQAVVA